MRNSSLVLCASNLCLAACHTELSSCAQLSSFTTCTHPSCFSSRSTGKSIRHGVVPIVQALDAAPPCCPASLDSLIAQSCRVRQHHCRTQTDVLCTAGRPTAPAYFWEEHPDLLAGKDLLGGGTWLGVTKTGRVAWLTNFREVCTMGCIRYLPVRWLFSAE